MTGRKEQSDIPDIHISASHTSSSVLTPHQEEALRLAAIVESSDDAIIGKTLAGIITSWNKGAEKIYGYTAREVIGRPISVLVPRERADEVPRILEKLKRGQHVDHFETERITKDGRRLAISLTISPVRDRTGQLFGAATIARDITKTKLAEAELRKSRKQMEVILQGVADSITVQDREGNIIYANDAAARALGFENAAELIEAPLQTIVDKYDLFDEEGEKISSQHLPGQIALKEGQSASRTLRYVNRKTGEERWSIIKATPIRDETGRVQLSVNIFQDITERKRAEESERFLAEASQVLASSLDYQTTLSSLASMAVPKMADWCTVDIIENGNLHCLVVAHADPNKIEWARTIQATYPPSLADQVGSPNVIRTGRPEIYPEISDQMLATAARDEEHLRMLREGGFTSAMLIPLIAEGRTLGVMTFVTAESKRHYGRADFSLAQDLARRAAQALEHSRLYRIAQEANRLKDEFLATVSHELRTPLTAISGYAHMLRTGKLTDIETQHALSVIERSVRSQSQLINDILDVSRVSTGKLQLNVRKIQPAVAISPAIDSLRPAAESKGIELALMLDNSAGTIIGDPDRLQQIAWNLVSNAIKFTPSGGRVEIVLQREGGHVQFEVKDNGIGIDPAFLPNVFERFRQADSSITRNYTGLGLGLAIVRHLVEMHGGTTEAQSKGLGHGASFKVRIPIANRSERPAGVHALPQTTTITSEPGTNSFPFLEGIRVLIVDDNADTCRLLETLFSKCDAHVKTAHSAREALQIIAKWPPNILLCDIGMPEEDGYSLLKEIRKASTADEIPAIALTGYARSEDRDQALAAGFQMHLAKPIDPAALLIAVESLTGKPISRTKS